MASLFSLTDGTQIGYIIILLGIMLALAISFCWIFKIKDWFPIIIIFAMFLIMANAFEVLPQIYALGGFVIISFLVYAKLNEDKIFGGFKNE